MIAGLKPYPEYKESGLSWLGQVPGHWSLERTKWRFRDRKELNASGAHTNILSLTLRGVVNNNPDDPEGLVPKDYRTYQFFAKGDLVFKLIDLENLRTSRVGLVHEDGIMSSAYVRLTPSRPANIRYFFHQFYDLYSRGIYNQLGAGVRSTLGPSDLLNVGIAIPPPEEQAAIVRFLDWANGRLERAIRAKRKVIALLNEQKQAIIHRTVTRGLSLSVPLKPSGISWLGDIPQHWEVRRLGRLAAVFNGTTPSRAQPAYWSNGTIPWLASGKVNERIINSPSELITARALEECNLTTVPSGALLMGLIGQGRTRGMCALLAIDACISQNLAAVVPGSVLFNQFLYYALVACYDDVREFGRGGNQPALNCEIVGRLPVPVPPVEEQKAICQTLTAQVSYLFPLEHTIEREIKLLREYRTRLVADVVTGKLDVREAAARLPEEALPDIVDEAADGLDETEPSDEEAAA